VFSEDDLRLRSHAQAGVDRGLEYGYWWVEWGGTLDTIKDNETIRDELLAIMLGVWDHIKNGGDHGAEYWALDWFGFLPGKRESRRFIGQHVLCEADVLESRPQPDAIAYGGWPVDRHPPQGIDAPHLVPAAGPLPAHLYDIPLRSCVSATVPNLMFAGRNLSATHVGFASIRVMATCAVVGQGVGTAAAYCAAHGVDPAGIAVDEEAIAAVQQRLLRDDAYLIGVRNNDYFDLAKRAEITASSAQAEGPALNVVTGFTRADSGPKGAPPARAVPGTGRWMSDPAAGLPAWLELRWSDPIEVAQVQLIFDTGLHRVLTLTQSDDYAARMQWGRPQPETVADYQIALSFGGNEWEPVVSETGNHQRRRVHDLMPCGGVRALRLTVTGTNGLDHARVCEVRVYARGL